MGAKLQGEGYVWPPAIGQRAIRAAPVVLTLVSGCLLRVMARPLASGQRFHPAGAQSANPGQRVPT